MPSIVGRNNCCKMEQNSKMHKNIFLEHQWKSTGRGDIISNPSLTVITNTWFSVYCSLTQLQGPRAPKTKESAVILKVRDTKSD